MNIEETRALRKMSRVDLKAKAEGMGITVQPDWGQPKLVSVIMKADAGIPIIQPQGAPTVVQDGDQDILATVATPADEASPEASAKELLIKRQAEASADLMRRQTELMHSQHARLIGTEQGQGDQAQVAQQDWQPMGTSQSEDWPQGDGIPRTSEHFNLEATPAARTVPSVAGHNSTIVHDEELLNTIDGWARTFINEFERAQFERSADTLTVHLTSRHGVTKVSVGGVVFTRPGVTEALAHLRRQAEGHPTEGI